MKVRFIDYAEDGPAQPGDMWFGTVHGEKCWLWDNCAGPHLLVKLPNGALWDIDSRASNCDMKEDRQHRCWVRHGEPPLVTVDKDGPTCHAGAGSILSGDWHGFLVNGELVGV